MGKGKLGRDKQDAIYFEFQRIIRNEKNSAPTLVQQILEETARKKEEFAKKRIQPVYRSVYNPNNPLNGSTSWTKEQWQEYKERMKAGKTTLVNNSK